MMSRSRFGPPALPAGLLILGLGLQGCVATAVAGATVHVAGAAVKTTAKVTGKVAGATVHAAGHALKGSPESHGEGRSTPADD